MYGPILWPCMFARRLRSEALLNTAPIPLGPKKHISISILWGYPYLIGFHYKGVYMGRPYPYFCLCAFWGPNPPIPPPPTLPRRSTVEARKLEHRYPHAPKVSYRESQH